jgi:hypothetical protein
MAFSFPKIKNHCSKDIAGQKHTIDIAKITSRKKEEKSLMPDPVSNGLNEKDLADVVGFLKSK